MAAFRVVKRTALPNRARFNGSKAGLPHARYHKVGNLFFSKKACEVFALRKRAIVEYDEEAHTLKFTGVDKPPKGLMEEDCFPLVWHEHKGTPTCASMAIKRLLTYLGLEKYKEACDFPVVSCNRETYSIVLALPADGNQAQDGDEAAESDSAMPQAGRNHVNVA